MEKPQETTSQKLPINFITLLKMMFNTGMGSGTSGLLYFTLTLCCCFPAEYIQIDSVQIRHHALLHLLIDNTRFWEKCAQPKILHVFPPGKL